VGGDRGQLKCGGTRAETRFRLSAKRTSPFKSARESVQSTTGSRGVRISGNNDGYTMFRGSVKGTGYPLHSPVSPSLPPRATPCAIIFQLEFKFFSSVVLANRVYEGVGREGGYKRSYYCRIVLILRFFWRGRDINQKLSPFCLFKVLFYQSAIYSPTNALVRCLKKQY